MFQDFETWSMTHMHYFSTEYHTLYKIIDHHCEEFHKMPTIEELKFEVRDRVTKEKLHAIESVEIDAEPHKDDIIINRWGPYSWNEPV